MRKIIYALLSTLIFLEGIQFYIKDFATSGTSNISDPVILEALKSPNSEKGIALAAAMQAVISAEPQKEELAIHDNSTVFDPFVDRTYIPPELFNQKAEYTPVYESLPDRMHIDPEQFKQVAHYTASLDPI